MPIPAVIVESDAPSPSSDGQKGEALRYLIASLAALAVDTGLLWIAVNVFALPVWIAGAIAYLAGLILIYVLSIHWVFVRRSFLNTRGEFAVFAALGLLGLFLNSLVLFAATGLGLALPLAKVLSASAGFVTNFVSRKALLFTGQAS